MKELEAQNKQLDKENKDYVKSIPSLEKKCKEKVATAEKQVEKYRERSSKSQEASVAASNKLNVKMKSKAAIHTNRHSSLQQTHQLEMKLLKVGVEKELENSNKKYSALEVKHNKLLNSKMECDAERNRLEEEVSSLKGEINAQKNETSELEKELSKVKGVYTRYKGQVEKRNRERDRAVKSIIKQKQAQKEKTTVAKADSIKQADTAIRQAAKQKRKADDAIQGEKDAKRLKEMQLAESHGNTAELQQILIDVQEQLDIAERKIAEYERLEEQWSDVRRIGKTRMSCRGGSLKYPPKVLLLILEGLQTGVPPSAISSTIISHAQVLNPSIQSMTCHPSRTSVNAEPFLMLLPKQ